MVILVSWTRCTEKTTQTPSDEVRSEGTEIHDGDEWKEENEDGEWFLLDRGELHRVRASTIRP
jgi:hypothetical protein